MKTYGWVVGIILCVVIAFVVPPGLARPVFAQDGNCGSAPSPYLGIGATAWVKSGEQPNRVRSGPGTGYNSIGQVRANEQFTIIDGPTCSNGYRWWQIRTGSGLEGWTADGSDGRRWLDTSSPQSGGSSGGVSQATGTLRVWNNTRSAICSVYWTLSNQSSPTWSSNPFQGNSIQPGTYRDTPPIPVGTYDVWVGDCSDNELHTEQDVVIAQGQTKEIYAGSMAEDLSGGLSGASGSGSGGSSSTTGNLEVDNRTSANICSLYWTPSGQSSPSWSSNPFEGSPIRPGEQATAWSITPGLYDVWIGDCSGNEVYTEQRVEVEAGVTRVLTVGSPWDNAGAGQSSSAFANDDDQDGMDNDLELWLAQTFNPYLIWDEGETVWQDYGYNSPTVTLLWQVTPNVGLPNGITCAGLITYVVLYPEDFGRTITYIDKTIEPHPGDNESARVCVTRNGDIWGVYSILIKRHYDEPVGYVVGGDYVYSAVTGEMAISALEFTDNTHVKLWVSEDKHAMYISGGECGVYDHVPDWPDWPFEDCDDGKEDYLPIYPAHNVGEREGVSGYDSYRNRWDEFPEAGSSALSVYSFECAWCNRTFCGIRSQPSPGRDSIHCAGSNAGKFWPPVSCGSSGACTVNGAAWNAQLAQLAWGQ